MQDLKVFQVALTEQLRDQGKEGRTAKELPQEDQSRSGGSDGLGVEIS